MNRPSIQPSEALQYSSYYYIVVIDKLKKQFRIGDLCFFNLEEARALEILIEKRLGIEDKAVDDEILA